VASLRGGEHRRLTWGSHDIAALSWSRHGLAYVGHDFHARGATNQELWLLREGEEPLCLTSAWDRSLGRGIGSDLRVATPNEGPVWGPQGEALYFLTGEVPHSSIYKVAVDGGEVTRLTSGVTVDGFSYSADFQRLAYVAMTATEPNELYVDGEKASHFNSRLLGSLALSKPEEYLWVNERGEKIHGWVMRPVGFREGERYPCILEIHGGPLGIYGDGIYQEFQVLASAGYAVIYTNPRGSAGYGEEYASTLNGRHGTVDYKDLMDFVDDAPRPTGSRPPWPAGAPATATATTATATWASSTASRGTWATRGGTRRSCWPRAPSATRPTPRHPSSSSTARTTSGAPSSKPRSSSSPSRRWAARWSWSGSPGRTTS